MACSHEPGPGSLVLQQEVVRADSTVCYWLAVGPDGVEVGLGTWADATVTFRQSEAVAASVHAGGRSAVNAFLDGDLEIAGQIGELTRAAQMLAENDPFADLRQRTTYGP